MNPNVFNLFNTIREFQVAMGDVTGVNESMMGTQGTSDALVGVTEAAIHRGSLIQEPFYYALTNILKQAYQHMATVGKKVMYDSPRRAAMALGDGGYQLLTITKDHLLEDFRIWIERTENKQTATNNANTLIFTLLQGGLLDQYRASMLLGRATPEQVTKSLREYQIEQFAAKKEQDKYNQQRMIQGQEQEQQMMQAQAQQQQQGVEMAIDQDEKDKEHDLQLQAMKGENSMNQAIVSSELNRRNNLENRNKKA
jgi:hypothetical protein